MTRMVTTRCIMTTILLLFGGTISVSLHLASAFAPPRPTAVLATSTTITQERRLSGGAAGAAALAAAAAHRHTVLFAEPQIDTTILTNKQQDADAVAVADAGGIVVDEKKKDDTAAMGEENSEETMLDKIKEAGLAGFISYAIWELAFWLVSIPIALGGYVELTGHWPDLANQDDLAKLGAEAFAFVNVARLAVPIRIGLAISTTPWVEQNIVERFSLLKDQATTKKDEENASGGIDDAGVDDEQQSKGENRRDMGPSATSKRRKGLVKRIVSILPFRRRHSKDE